MTDSSWQDEIALREASLVDAAREHAAGELDDDTYAEIVAREEVALAALRARTPQAATPRAPKPRRRRKTSRLVVGLVCLSLAAVGIVWLNVSLRQAGSQVTGGIQASTGQRVTQLLLEAQADSAANNDTAALAAYQSVLQLAPTNVTALTEAGWLTFSAGSASHNAAIIQVALRDLRTAVRLAPNQAAPHLYYGLVAYVTPANTAIATQQFSAFLASHPSRGQLAVATPYLRALHLLR